MLIAYFRNDTSGFLACKATGDGDCLKKERLYKKKVPTKRLHLKEDSSDERSSEESSEESLFRCKVSED